MLNNRKHIGKGIGFNSGVLGKYIASIAPSALTAPTISGIAEVGEVLTAVNGTYSGSPTITGIWQRDGVDITGETDLTYTQVGLDVEKSLTWNETGTNVVGSTTSDSNAILTLFNPLSPVFSLNWAVDADNILVNGTSTTMYDYFGVDNIVNPTAGQQPLLVSNAYGIYDTLRFVAGNLLKKSVANWRAGDSTGQMTFVIKFNTDSTNNFWGSGDEATTKNIWGKVDTSNKFGYVDNGGNGGGGNLTGGNSLNIYTTFIVTFLQNGTTGKLYISNILETLSTNTIGVNWLNDLPTQRDNITLGGYQASTIGNCRADISFGCYGTDTTEATILELHKSLINKYNLQFYNIVIDGDSIDFGTGASFEPTFKTKLNTTPVERLLSNVALSGQELGGTAPNMITRYSPDAKLNDMAVNNILLMGGGTNDICSLIARGRTPSSIFADWQIYYNHMVSLGYIVVPRTVLPRSNVTCGNLINFEADRQTYNTLIKNYCAANSIVLCNCGDDATIGVFGASDNTTYYNGDKIHLKQAGADILGNLYGDAVLAVLAAL